MYRLFIQMQFHTVNIFSHRSVNGLFTRASASFYMDYKEHEGIKLEINEYI